MVRPSSLAVLLALLGLACRHDVVAPPAASPSPPPSPLAVSPTPPARVERDLLRYGDASPSPASADGEAPPAGPEPPLQLERAAPPARARLVGLVRRPARLCAALVLDQREPDLLCPGDEAHGYRLLALDEERGARLGLPEGGELDVPFRR